MSPRRQLSKEFFALFAQGSFHTGWTNFGPDRLNLCRKIAYAQVESIRSAIGNEATRVHHAYRRRGGGCAVRGARSSRAASGVWAFSFRLLLKIPSRTRGEGFELSLKQHGWEEGRA
jgi:hypothetical protein